MRIGLSQYVLVCLLFILALSGVTQVVSQLAFLSVGLEHLSPYGLHSIVWWVSNLRASNLSNLEPMDAELDMWPSGCRTCVIGHHVPRHQCLMLSRSLLLTSSDFRFVLLIRFVDLYFMLLMFLFEDSTNNENKTPPFYMETMQERTRKSIAKKHAEIGSFTPLAYLGASHTRFVCPSRCRRYFRTCSMAT